MESNGAKGGKGPNSVANSNKANKAQNKQNKDFLNKKNNSSSSLGGPEDSWSAGMLNRSSKSSKSPELGIENNDLSNTFNFGQGGGKTSNTPSRGFRVNSKNKDAAASGPNIPIKEMDGVDAKKAADAIRKLASGNIIGGIKDAIKSGLAKKVLKKMKRKFLMSLIPFFIMVIMAVCVFGLLDSMKDEMVNLLSSVGTTVTGFLSKMWQKITNDYWIDLDDKTRYVMDVDTGETLGIEGKIPEERLEGRNTIVEEDTLVDKYVKELGNQQISIKDLRLLGNTDYSRYATAKELLSDEHNKQIIEKYIAEFIRADIITQQPNRRGKKELVNPSNQNEIDGGVFIYRGKESANLDINEEMFEEGGTKVMEEDPMDDQGYKLMSFETEEQFAEDLGVEGIKKISQILDQEFTLSREKAKDLRYKYTIDTDTGELVFLELTTSAEMIEEGVEVDDSFLDIPNMIKWFKEYFYDNSTDYTARLVKIDYKRLISKYSMPYEFLINLCEVTQNPEFVYHVALLARETEINLVLEDNMSLTIEGHYLQSLEVKDFYNPISDDPYSAAKTDSVPPEWQDNMMQATQTKTPVLRIKSADTWSWYEEFEYKRITTTTDEVDGPNVIYPPWPRLIYHPPDQATGTAQYWDYLLFPTKLVEKTRVLTVDRQYEEVGQPIVSIEKSKKFLGLLRDEDGKCPVSCYEETAWRRAEPEALKCVEEACFLKSGTNVTYRLPNSNEKEAPLNKLTSGLDMMYAIMQSNSSGYMTGSRTDFSAKNNDRYSISLETEQPANDYVSLYVGKMQGLVEHLRYLMTFPENEEYSKFELNGQEHEDREAEEEESDVTGENISEDYIIKTDEEGALPPLTKEQLILGINSLGKINYGKKEIANALTIVDTLISGQDSLKVNAAYMVGMAHAEQSTGVAKSTCAKNNNWYSLKPFKKFYSSPNENTMVCMTKIATSNVSTIYGNGYFVNGVITMFKVYQIWETTESAPGVCARAIKPVIDCIYEANGITIGGTTSPTGGTGGGSGGSGEGETGGRWRRRSRWWRLKQYWRRTIPRWN